MGIGMQRKRLETGVFQMGDDWPGIFIRGDNAMAYSMALYQLLNGCLRLETSMDKLNADTMHELADLLKSCNQSSDSPPTAPAGGK